MEAVVIDAGSKILKAGFAIPDQAPSMVGLHAEHGYARSLARFAANLGPVVWEIASKKLEKALPPGTKFAPGLVGENDPPPPPSSFFPPGNLRPMPGLRPDSVSNRPQTPSTSGPNPKVEIIEPDSGIRMSSPSHHVRNGFNTVFGSTPVEQERVCEGGGGLVKPTSQPLHNDDKGVDI